MSAILLRQPMRVLMCQRWLSARTLVTVLNRANDDSVQGTKFPMTKQVGLSTKIFIRSMAKSKDRGKDKSKGKGLKTKLTDEEMMQVIDVAEMREKMFKIVEKLKLDYINNLSLKTGQGIENLQIEFEKETYPLKELATISRKGNSLIVLNLTALPDAIKPVINTINDSGMNLNPQQEGTMVYLTVPKITREHRETLAKNAKTLFQKSKETIVKVSNAYMKEAREKSTYEKLSEDLVVDVCHNVKAIADAMVAECESILTLKVNELLQAGDKDKS